MYKLNLFKHSFTLDNAHLEKVTYLTLWGSPAVVADLHRDARGRTAYVCHDGPPYANGSLHLGHFVNKTLKDATAKFKRMQGYFSPYVPGFDCHGLPVELEVEKAGHSKTDPMAFVAACRAYAKTQVALQTTQFQSFGVAADWAQAYRTLDPSFEAGASALFSSLPGAVKRLRPVHWCPDCASSLAEAEVEYKPRLSDSVVVLFALASTPGTYLEVWTTTPYTLPANQAVAFNPGLAYVAVTDSQGRVRVRLGHEGEARLPRFELAGTRALSPYTGVEVPVLPADYVSRAGTGLVHLAPAFGTDDFRVGEANGLAVTAWLDERGRFLPHTGKLAGMTTAQAAAHVLETVAPLVVSHEQLEHEYPHCWRHKRAVFFRASEEWFLDLGATGPQALQALEDVTFVPSSGKERMRTMLQGRSSWCVSRNRLWGTPLVDPSNPNDVRLAARVASEGVEAWQSEGPRRTLDVWFDSGVTHELVMRKRFGQSADVYFEGSDQHRGWFQSSLLTAVAAGGPAPYRAVVTHSFVVDAQGQKLSKSSRNYEPLDQLLTRMSPDVLRLWTLQQDFSKELKFSPEALALTKDRYRKLRNTMRFCLQNLQDFDWQPRRLTRPANEVQVVLLRMLAQEVSEAANDFNFAGAVQALTLYAESVSSGYFAAVKDALYCDAANSSSRREAQYVLSLVLQVLMALLAPVLSYTAEEVFQHVRESARFSMPSVLMFGLADVSLPEVPNSQALLEAYRQVQQLRAQLNQQVVTLRESGNAHVKGPAQVELAVQTEPDGLLAQMMELLGCAQVLAQSTAGAEMPRFWVTSRLACACCREHRESVQAPGELCERCDAVQAVAA